jgi:ABC-type dipeptide/oligopeptide/nickel transport system permease component
VSQIPVRRLLVVIPTLLVVSMLSFAIMRAAPGDPVQTYVTGGRPASKESRHRSH